MMRRIRKSAEATSNLPHLEDDVTATLDLAQTRHTAPHGIPGAARPLDSAPIPSGSDGTELLAGVPKETMLGTGGNLAPVHGCRRSRSKR